MKRYLLILTLIVAYSSCLSAEVSSLAASKVAVNFYFERASQFKQIAYENISVEDILTIRSGDRPLLYAVNIRDGGFVLVSATRRTMAVPGYSIAGRYTGIGLPPQLQDLLDQYTLRIANAIDKQLTATPSIEKMWKRLEGDQPGSLEPLKDEKSLEPLLSTQWDQGNYYNEACPADPAGPGGHCYAGCVATALGQVVNYFRWPLSGTGSYTYSCPPYGTLTGDFENTEYEWDMMATSLNRSNMPLALLLHHLGIACDMVYGPNGSGMYNHKAAYALRTFFRYSPETIYVYRDSTNMDWDSLIISHLDRKIPLYYAGWSVPNINGHAFVCDGYQDGNYYHFNWGWSGSYDGYFYTNALNPGGSNFNLAQELIINAYPDTINYNYPYYCQGDKVLNSLDGTIGDGSGPHYDYQAGADCSWLIAPEDSVNNITLEFIHFNTENSDILNIYDGASANAPLIGSYSGADIPDDISSTGDRLFLSFASNGEGEGFLIAYRSEVPVYCSGTTVFTAQTESFSDGSGPRDYHNGTQCIWMINPPDASECTLYFTSFNTEDSNDLVQVYDLDTQLELASFSGNINPPPVTSPSGKIFLTFSTNGSVTAPGWDAYYETDLVGIPEPGIIQDLQVYPNPVSGQVALSWTSETNRLIRISVCNMNGQELLQRSHSSVVSQNEAILDLSAFPEGIYLLNIDTGQDVMHRKLIVQH